MKKIIILFVLGLFVIQANAQVKTQQPKVYHSVSQTILKGHLADATEETVKHKVTISVLLNQFDFVYPNKEMKDVSVKMTQAEWKDGVREEDYVIKSHPAISEIYFERDRNRIWLNFKDGTTIIYNLTVPTKKR